MLELQKPNDASKLQWASEEYIPNIAALFKTQTGKRLILSEIKNTNGKKTNYWENESVDIISHLRNIQRQGGNLCYQEDGKKFAVAAVVDIDQPIEPIIFCKETFKIDTKAIPVRSPSGKNWHVWNFYSQPVPVAEAAKWARETGHKFKKLNYKVDFGKCNPRDNGSQVGINFPFCNQIQVPFDPRGNVYSPKQFLHRLKFNSFPYIALTTNLKTGENRYDALLLSASILNDAGEYKPEYVEEIADNFGTLFDDEKQIEKVKEKCKIYHYNPETIEKSIADLIGDQEFKFEDVAEAKVKETITPLELNEYTGDEPLVAREWIIEGWLLSKALTLVVGQAGVGKTIFLAMLAASLAHGGEILGKIIKATGNVLILASEETQNEIRLRLTAICDLLNLHHRKSKIFFKGLEDQIKLVNFTLTEAKATKAYKQLELSLKKDEIKFIIIDPLISFQTGAYDENNNAKMEQFVKDFIIPLAVKNNGAVIAGHHTNKFSMLNISKDGKELEVDHQIALNAARGASSLVAAARFVIAFQPMTKKIFEKKFKDLVDDNSKFTHYAGLIEAKSNYSIVEDDITWLKKNSVSLDVIDTKGNSTQEQLGVFTVAGLNKLTKAKNKLKAEKNETYVRDKLPLIIDLMVNDECTLNAAVEACLLEETDYADDSIEEKTLKTRVRRQIVNGLHGEVGGDTQGISYDDGFNYWLKIDNSRKGAAKFFIQRGKDLKRGAV